MLFKLEDWVIIALFISNSVSVSLPRFLMFLLMYLPHSLFALRNFYGYSCATPIRIDY